MNPLKTEISIKQGEYLGDAEIVDPKNVQTILSPESFTDQSNNSIRRIQLDKDSEKGNSSLWERQSEAQFADNDKVVPEHLLGLYNRSSNGKTLDESQSIFELLCKDPLQP